MVKFHQIIYFIGCFSLFLAIPAAASAFTINGSASATIWLDNQISLTFDSNEKSGSYNNFATFDSNGDLVNYYVVPFLPPDPFYLLGTDCAYATCFDTYTFYPVGHYFGITTDGYCQTYADCHVEGYSENEFDVVHSQGLSVPVGEGPSFNDIFLILLGSVALALMIPVTGKIITAWSDRVSGPFRIKL